MPQNPWKRRPVRLPEAPSHAQAWRCLRGAGWVTAWLTVLSPVHGADTKDGTMPNGTSFPPAAIEFFEARIRPVLVEKCVKCHGPKKQSGGLRLDSRESLLKGGDSGPAAVAANPDASLLIQAVAHTHPELKMPPSGKLSEPSIALLRQWVTLGVPWSPSAPTQAAGASIAAESAVHWAFQPVRRPATPAVRDRQWLRTPVDAFVLARLEAAGVAPSPRADKRTLIRRATFDLWGMPPTAEEVDAFESDNTADAYARLVERLLASPRYGERWGRHWLDVARYADTKGYVFTQDRRYPYAYTYRDYVVGAFNADVPFDKFVVAQLAADQLAEGERGKSLAAMGFLTVGRRFLLDQNEIIDDRIDVVTRGLLGLTVTCARCHDHKFDPIPTEDYYSLYGVFASSHEPDELPVLGRPGDPSKVADYHQKLNQAMQARDQFLAARRDELLAELRERLSDYLRVAGDLGFDAGNPKLEERGLERKLNTRRLRAVMTLWIRYIERSRGRNDAIIEPWIAFAALPADQFAAKASEVKNRLTTGRDPKAPPLHPLVARAVLANPPTKMADVVERYASLLAELESKLKPHAAKAQRSLPEPEWESLRTALFGNGGALSVSVEGMGEFLDQTQSGQFDQLKGAIVHLESTHPGAPARAMVMMDNAQPEEPHVFLRGNPGRPGKAIPRRFLRVLAEPNRPAFQKGSGRLEMAQAIANPKNPLTARVFVNRVWLWHFGKGLVDTASDFGLRSDPPTHPELLDCLATDFIESGWSLKTLHRRILLSSTYQQSSVPRPDALERDPDNRLIWRFNRQRLDFESMRDSLLAVSGALDPAIGGPAAALTEPPFPTRRTVYGFIDRQNLDGLYRTFDFAIPDATSPRRFVTTVPQQALFLMNSPFLHDQARRLSERALESAGGMQAVDSPAEIAESVRRLYRLALGRSPEPEELALALDYIHKHPANDAAVRGAWRGAAGTRKNGALSPWEQLSQVLLLTNEFMFVD